MTRPRFVDSHAHLDPENCQNLDAVLDTARAAGLTDIVCIGASSGFETNERTLEVVAEHPGLFATVGIHPHDSKIVTDEIEAKIRNLAQDPKVVALGEFGLDYHYDLSPREAQRSAFERFAATCADLQMPCVVHTRDAEDDTISILRNANASAFGGVIHCFTGTDKLADAALDMGFFISFSGVLTFRNADRLRSIAARLPRDRVLVETDCPYLTPVPLRGQPNQPAFITHTADKLAELWAMDPAEARAQTAANAIELFGLNRKDGAGAL